MPRRTQRSSGVEAASKAPESGAGRRTGSELSPLSRIAVAARSLLRLLPTYDPGPKDAFTLLAVATVEAIAYRAALILLSGQPSGHRAAAKTASALFPKEPGRALSEAMTAWEAGDAAQASKLAQREIEETRSRLEGTSLDEPSRAAHLADLRFLTTGQDVPDLQGFFARPLFGPQGSRELEKALAGWASSLETLGLAEGVGRRYQGLLSGDFPKPHSLLLVLDAWAAQIERLPADSPAAEDQPAVSRPAPKARGPRRAARARGGLGRFTALGETLAERDLLGRQPLVEALASMCADRSQGTPFTLALIGEWGVGKSSVMNLLRRRLEEEGNQGQFATVWFNAWEHENTGNMAAALAQEVIRGLLSGLSTWQRLRLRIRFAIRLHRWSVFWALLRLLGAVLLFPAARWALRGAEPFLQAILGVGVLAGIGAFVILLRRDLKQLWEHPLALELKTYFKLPDYGEHLGFLPVVKEHVRALCDLCMGDLRDGSHRLVCFIDDLDRCRADTLIQALEAIRLLMDEKDCIVILGCDYRIALAAVGERYKDLETETRKRQQIARDYLGKVVQLAIHLEGSTGANLQRFVGEQLFPLSPVEDVASPQTDGLEPSGPRSPAGEAAKRGRDHPDRRPMPAVDLALEMRHTAEEQQLFSRLASEHRFTNPRLLLRLRNGYRLLRLIEAQTGQRPLPLPLLMRAIFWQEFLHQWPREIRGRLEAALRSPEPQNDLPEPAREVLRTVAPELQRLLGEGAPAQLAYQNMTDLAARLILPHGD